MNCPNCGGTVPPGATRCLKCGSFVEQAAPAAQPQQYVQAQPQMQPQQVVYQQAVPMGPPKSKVAAGLLGIFLGSLGIHRFYLGYTGIGLAQLLLTVVGSWVTCGISAMVASLWGFIEGILILTGSINKDSKGQPLQ